MYRSSFDFCVALENGMMVSVALLSLITLEFISRDYILGPKPTKKLNLLSITFSGLGGNVRP